MIRVESTSIQFSERTQTILNKRNVATQHQQAFKDILEERYEHSEQSDRDFFYTLSASQLETLRAVKGDRIFSSDKISDEGMANLFTLPGEEIDMNGDMISEIGSERIVNFPPSSAPEEVKQSFEKLEPHEKLRLIGLIGFKLFSANVYKDESGKICRRTPEDPGYVDIFKQPGFTYEKLVDDLIYIVNDNAIDRESERYIKQIQMLEKFKEGFINK